MLLNIVNPNTTAAMTAMIARAAEEGRAADTDDPGGRVRLRPGLDRGRL